MYDHTTKQQEYQQSRLTIQNRMPCFGSVRNITFKRLYQSVSIELTNKAFDFNVGNPRQIKTDQTISSHLISVLVSKLAGLIKQTSAHGHLIERTVKLGVM